MSLLINSMKFSPRENKSAKAILIVKMKNHESHRTISIVTLLLKCVKPHIQQTGTADRKLGTSVAAETRWGFTLLTEGT